MTRRLGLFLCILGILTLLPASAAVAWSNGPDGGDSFGTHEWILHEANRMAVGAGFDWANMAVAQPASDDPDGWPADAVNHAYDPWSPTPYGDAPTAIAALYRQTVAELQAGNPAAASRSLGLLSHYYADICDPLQTAQNPSTTGLRSAYENDVETFTDAPGLNRVWLTFDGYQTVWDPAYKARKAAEKAHDDAATLAAEYQADGYDTAVETITLRSLNLAANGLADIIISIAKDAGVAVPAQAFDQTRAMRAVHDLAEGIGVRVGGTQNETAAFRYAKAYLKGLGYAVDTIPVGLPNGRVSHDVRVTKPGRSTLTIVVGAHIDTKSPSPGANDNASGVGAVLELARDMKDADTEATLQFVLFGTEELIDSNPSHDHFGSRAFVQGLTAAERTRLVGMISVDMIGCGDLFTIGTMNRGPRQLCDALLAYSNTHGLAAAFQLDEGKYGWSDHAPFELAGYPVAWMEWGDDPAYHSSRDTYDHLDPTLLGRTGSMLLGFLSNVGQVQLASLASAKR